MEVIDEEPLKQAVGENVTRLRKLRGISQGELAEKVGVSAVHLNRIEKGHALPGAGLLFALADQFGVKADELRQHVPKKISAAAS